MKRFLTLGLLVAIAAIVAGPGAIGRVAEFGHARAVDHARALGHVLETERYERGWFSSQARHRYRIDDPHLAHAAAVVTGQARDNALLVTSHLHHGPLPALGGASLAPAWSEAQSSLALRDRNGTEHALPGILTSRLEPAGASRFRYRAAAGTRALQRPLEAAWDDIAIDVEMNRAGTQIAFDGNIGNLEIYDDTARAALGPTRLLGEHRREAAGVWSGSSEWHVETISAPRFRADQLTLKTRIAVTPGEPAYRITAGASRLDAETFAGDNPRIDLELQNVDAVALAEALELIASAGVAELFAPQRRELLQRVLIRGPTLILHQLRLPAADGALEGNAQLSVTPGTTDRLAMADALSARADFAVPRSLIDDLAAGGTDQVRAAIELMVQFRILRPEGARYRVRANFGNGVLQINGFPVPLPAF